MDIINIDTVNSFNHNLKNPIYIVSDSKLTPEMKNAGENLVKYGKTLGYLKEDCNIIDQPK